MMDIRFLWKEFWKEYRFLRRGLHKNRITALIWAWQWALHRRGILDYIGRSSAP